MSGTADLERRYRRLLAWYPRPFRSEHAQEILAVLMASARPGQRRPSLPETANLIRAALYARLRPVRSGPASPARAEGLAVFSALAPLLVVAVSLLEVVLPYHLRADRRFPVLDQLIARQPEAGGLSLLTLHGFSFRSPVLVDGRPIAGGYIVHPGFDIAVGGQVIIAALVLLGLRRAALTAIAASALYWFLAAYTIPQPVQLLIISGYLLETAALIASRGLRRGRPPVTWRHGLVLLLVAAAVQASTLWWDAATSVQALGASISPGYLVTSGVLIAVAAGAAVALRVNRYVLLLLAALLYPCAAQIAFAAASPDRFNADLIGLPTPGHVTLLYLPLALLTCWTILAAVMPRRPRPVLSSGPDKPGVA